MKLFKKTYSFDKSEVFIIFLLLIFCGILVFSIGIMIGKKMLEQECKIMLEDLNEQINTCNTDPAINKEATNNVVEKDKVLNETQELDEKKIDESKSLKVPTINTVNKAKTNNIKTPPPGTNNKGADLEIKTITNDINNKYTVQVGAFQDELEARNKTYALYSDGYKSAYYMKVVLAQKGVWYRVGIGFFPKKNSAELFAQMLKRQGKINSFIIRKIQ